jgi:ubiquinone/menaquinone biosynthesis C-methylase UbiE
VVCALALTHVPDLAPVLAEFARVLRPGGHLVISDPSGPPGGYLGSPVIKPLPGGRFGYLPHHNHRASDYLAAAIPLGLQVRRCEEPSMQYAVFGPDVTPASGPSLPTAQMTTGRCSPGARRPRTPPTVTPLS